MLTIDDVAAIPLFSALALPELELLATTSADIHLRTGEYAVHEGGEERALFAVLSGKMEVVRLIDGVERSLGWRVPGAIFGEIPIAIAEMRRFLPEPDYLRLGNTGPARVVSALAGTSPEGRGLPGAAAGRRPGVQPAEGARSGAAPRPADSRAPRRI
jgi:thioredoxin reductase (NADPH)